MTSIVALVVDVQNDFCEGGSLAVTGGARVAEGISNHLSVSNFYEAVIASRDEHAAPPSDNLGHFALSGEPDYKTSWPVHCVRGTHGAAHHKNLHLAGIDGFVVKGYGCQSYSAFEAVEPRIDGLPLLATLRSFNIEQIDIMGLALDFCVAATAFDAVSLGFKTRVISSLTAAVHPEYNPTLFTNLARAGVDIVA